MIKNKLTIRRRSDYIIGFITPAIGPNKSKKLTRLIAPAHNIRGKVWMKNNVHGFTADNSLSVKPCMLFFHSNFAAYIVCLRYKPCEFPGFVWTDCWGNKSYYVITSPANSADTVNASFCTNQACWTHPFPVQRKTKWTSYFWNEFPLGTTLKLNHRLTGGSVLFRLVSVALNNGNRPELNGTTSLPMVGFWGFWSRPLFFLES